MGQDAKYGEPAAAKMVYIDLELEIAMDPYRTHYRWMHPTAG
jgi:hypothetical protein